MLLPLSDHDYSAFRWELPSMSVAGKEMMRIALNIVAILLVLAGATWFLQGINVLPGSFMTGQIRWAIYGGVAVAAGVALLVTANRSAKKR